MRRQQDEQSKVFYELSALILNILRPPPTSIEFSDNALSASSSGSRKLAAASMQQITPARFASLLLGISSALMLCGSVTFFIGFLMMPWVLGLVMIYYTAATVYSLSMIVRAILSHISSPPSPRKDVQSWKFF